MFLMKIILEANMPVIGTWVCVYLSIVLKFGNLPPFFFFLKTNSALCKWFSNLTAVICGTLKNVSDSWACYAYTQFSGVGPRNEGPLKSSPDVSHSASPVLALRPALKHHYLAKVIQLILISIIILTCMC